MAVAILLELLLTVVGAFMKLNREVLRKLGMMFVRKVRRKVRRELMVHMVGLIHVVGLV